MKHAKRPLFLLTTLLATMLLLSGCSLDMFPWMVYEEQIEPIEYSFDADVYLFTSVDTSDENTRLYRMQNEDGEQTGWFAVSEYDGYCSVVEVSLSVDMNGDVTNAAIGDERFYETAGFGQRWIDEPERLEQFLDLNVSSGGMIEAITGATITSNAVLNATNAALESIANAAGLSERAPVVFGILDNYFCVSAPIDISDDTQVVAAKGLLSDVTVYVTLDDAGAIASISVDCSGETPAISGPCAEDAFLSQFIGKTGPFTDVDVVSGATYTSNAVINAVNSLFLSTQEPSAEVAAETLTASAKGLLSDVTVYVTLDDAGAIASISVDCSGETPAISGPCAEDAFLSQFIGKTGPFTDIDVVSGATFTSNAVINAVNSLFPVD